MKNACSRAAFGYLSTKWAKTCYKSKNMWSRTFWKEKKVVLLHLEKSASNGLETLTGAFWAIFASKTSVGLVRFGNLRHSGEDGTEKAEKRMDVVFLSFPRVMVKKIKTNNI